MSEQRRPEEQSADTSLMRRVAQGDEAAVEALYSAHADAVFRFVYRRVELQREDAEEITEDTFLSAITLARNYHATCSILTWLCGIATVRVIDFYRKQGREKRVPAVKLQTHDEEALQSLQAAEFDSESFVEQIVNRLDAADLAGVMLQALPDDEREVLMLRHIEEFSVREIAHLMKRSEKAIEHLLIRAKKKAAVVAARRVRECMESADPAARNSEKVS